MSVSRSWVGAVWLAAAIGCSNDDSGSPAGRTGDAGAASGANAAAGAPTSGDDVCEEGCRATLAAACEHGPADQAGCEADCRALGAGDCRDEYAALQRCAAGQPITCTAGYPVVASCATEQGAFVACENR